MMVADRDKDRVRVNSRKVGLAVFSVLFILGIGVARQADAVQWPVKGQSSRQLGGLFGDWRGGECHSAIDIPCNREPKIAAIRTEIVRSIWLDSESMSWEITTATLGQADEFVHYAHLLAPANGLAVDDTVSEGQTIAGGVVPFNYPHLDLSIWDSWDSEGLGYVKANPLDPSYLGPLYPDTSPPDVESLLDNLGLFNNDGSNGTGYVYYIVDPWRINGRVDVYAKAHDNNNSPPGYEGGICRIYYNCDAESIEVQVDNFAPYVEELKIFYLFGEPGAQDTTFVYHGKWKPELDENDEETGQLELGDPVCQEAAPNAQLSFWVKFSEYIIGPGCPSYIQVRFVHEDGEAEYTGLIAIPVNEYRDEFAGHIVNHGGSGPSPNIAPFGKYTVEIKANDLAGNYLDTDPSTPAIRNADGTWNDATYDPATNNADTNHYFNVAPALWVVERHCNTGTHRLAA